MSAPNCRRRRRRSGSHNAAAPPGHVARGAASGLARLLHLGAQAPGATHALHQADWLAGRLLGLLVDAVGQVARVGERQVAAPPDEVRTAGADAVTGVARMGQRLLVLLDLSRALSAFSPSTVPVS